MTIIDEIKEKIKEKHIKPRAKWRFLIVNYGWWLLFGLLFLITSIGFGVVLYLLKGSDWEIVRLVSSGFWGRLVLVMPRLWLGLLAITTILAVWEFRKTRKGYRYDIAIILAIVVIGSMLFGALVYSTGLGERLDTVLTDNMPLYRGRLHQQMDLWDRADQGFLIGRVIDFDDKHIILNAPHGIEHSIDLSRIENVDDLDLQIDSVLKVAGELMEDIFFADNIVELEMERFVNDHRPSLRPFMSPKGMQGERFSPLPAYK